MTTEQAPRRRLATRLTADALRQVRAGHPWIYAEAITSITNGGAAGDLAVVFDDRRRFNAIGLYDPRSPIRIKVLHRGQPVTIDDAWWRDRIAAAATRRQPLVDIGRTTAYRVVHGENDGLPGLVVDRYGDVAVVKLYSEALVPHLVAVRDAVVDVLAPATVVLRSSRLVAPALADLGVDGRGHGVAIVGSETPDGPVPFLENALHFHADVVRGQKTGHFLDQRDNRSLVRHHARRRTVLDVFTCTGGFAVHAAAGGARSVHLIDQSAAAIGTALENRVLNEADPTVAACPFTSEVGDAFEIMTALARAGRRFDLVVVDPPSFAASQARVPAATRAYRRLTRLALPLVAPNGLLLQASCSGRISTEDFMIAVRDEARGHGVRLVEIERTGHPLDHPVGFPQGGYLKAVLARVEH